MSAAPALIKDEDIAALVALLPEKMRQRLARGPVTTSTEVAQTSPLECRCCQALSMVPENAPESVEDAVARLILYHQGSDLYAPHHPTDIGNTPECYRRCVLIYRAAGWSPSAAS